MLSHFCNPARRYARIPVQVQDYDEDKDEDKDNDKEEGEVEEKPKGPMLLFVFPQSAQGSPKR